MQVLKGDNNLRIKIAVAIQLRNYLKTNLNKRTNHEELMNALLEVTKKIANKREQEVESYDMTYNNVISMILYHYCCNSTSDVFINKLLNLIYETLKDPLFKIFERSFILSFITFFIEENEYLLFSHLKEMNDLVNQLVHCLSLPLKRSINDSKLQQSNKGLRWIKYSYLSKILFIKKRLVRFLLLSPISFSEIYELNKFILISTNSLIKEEELISNLNSSESSSRDNSIFYSMIGEFVSEKNINFVLSPYEAFRINELCLKLNYNLVQNNLSIFITDFQFQLSYIFLSPLTYDYHINMVVLDSIELVFDYYQELLNTIANLKKKIHSNPFAKGRMNCFYSGCYSKSNDQKNYMLEELNKELQSKLDCQKEMCSNINSLVNK